MSGRTSLAGPSSTAPRRLPFATEEVTMESERTISSTRALSVFFGTEHLDEDDTGAEVPIASSAADEEEVEDDTESRILRRLSDRETETTVQLRGALRLPVLKLAKAIAQLSRKDLIRVERRGDDELLTLTTEGLR